MAAKLKRLAKVLSRWSRTVFGDIFAKMREYEDTVQNLELVLQQHPEDERALIEYQKGVALLKRQIAIEEEFWQQKGTCNRGARGQGIAQQAVSFFERMFTAEVGGFDLARLDCIPQLVMEDDNDLLTAVPGVEEVKEVVMQMSSTSAAGPDGFSGAFYKACWDIIQDDVFAMVRSFFAGRDFTSSKVVTKLMVVRMAMILPRVLSPQQSGFVAGRSIMDNVLLASEMCYGLSRQNKDIVLKLDMAKAYDRVSWFFLTSVMRRLGFSEVWIDMVFRAVSNVWYSVIVNGIKEGFFYINQRAEAGGSPIPDLICYCGGACAPPKQVVRDLERCFASFFWKKSGGAQYHWSSWKTLSLPKKEGGVGFLDLELMVRAASAKLWWNFRTEHTLWSDFMRAKYCTRVHPVAKVARYSD
ncbi:PREDICTED: uncharacterized protein LOC109158506 [Ipomoea nil]|uniref:uncharacterized protein LOC109158506 n=1 Tax=Ipomoea nil TaxID=35883 RepID=UPI0009009CFA|nr:PREDICTED: uncharacterized protein LOC109158506 [Ipomoea nil]